MDLTAGKAGFLRMSERTGNGGNEEVKTFLLLILICPLHAGKARKPSEA